MDGGKTWATCCRLSTVLSLNGVTFDACSDPPRRSTPPQRLRRRILFEINLADTAIVVAKSNAGIGGAFYHTPPPFRSRSTGIFPWVS